MSVLSASDVRAYYNTRMYGNVTTVQAVDGVTFNVGKKEIYGIAGESGCGKSTLLKTLAGLIKSPLELRQGEIEYDFDDRSFDLSTLRKEENRGELYGKYVSYIPQSSMNNLNPVHRIKKIFKDFIRAHRDVRGEEIERMVREYLDQLGLDVSVLEGYPHQLSGGMRQRVTLALSSILRPRIIFADEPTTALDVVVQRGVIQLIKKINREQENSILVVTHNMAIHANLCDRLAIMYAGEFAEENYIGEIFDSPLHPYSEFLMDSLPEVGDKSQKASAPGSPPSLTEPPAGCRFHSRCPKVMEICKEQDPELFEKNGGRVACHAVEGGSQ